MRFDISLYEIWRLVGSIHISRAGEIADSVARGFHDH